MANDLPVMLGPEVPGTTALRVLTPTIIEWSFTGRGTEASWNFVKGDGKLNLPGPTGLVLKTEKGAVEVKRLGFKRRVSYAPLRTNDLRVANALFFELAEPLPENSRIELRHSFDLPVSKVIAATNLAKRWSPAVHVNQTGYTAGYPKQAMVGYYLGTLGELELPGGTGTRYYLLDAGTGKEVFTGEMKPRRDQGFPTLMYQKVMEADFTKFETAGEYRLWVPGLGTSFPFRIGPEVIGAFARTYALGLYHQRCGTANGLPFTRFEHGPCHTLPAEVPQMSHEMVNFVLKQETENAREEKRHTARRLENVAACLYPAVNRGPVDVRGGHHDAGDYSKYTINSAGLVHHLVFAADVFTGAGDLDNLGIPESGDGKSDLLQEAKWEADFLLKMQDADGGFYFLVYPRERRYEDNVLPDKGDPQVLFPKTTAVSAAAVAALAQCAGSPRFKEQFPESAARYLQAAKRGWGFIEAAIRKHGKDGAYQKITHYGHQFLHDDELAWAACELYLATGEKQYEQRLLEWFRPSDPASKKWGWLRLFDAYGCAIRSYAFGAKSGRVPKAKLNAQLLEECEEELIGAADEHVLRAQRSAYGVSFPEETKRAGSAGWFFASDAAFELATGWHMDHPPKNDPKPRYMAAIISNLNYEQGCNPVNVTYVTGLGWKRQMEIVHNYAQNDRRAMPITGVPLGNIQGGFGWLENYKQTLGKLSYPPDDHARLPYPFYDRWGDSFNLSQEFVVLNQARAAGYLAWLMAKSPLKDQPWRGAAGRIEPGPGANGELTLSVEGLDLKQARTVWETDAGKPQISPSFKPPGQEKPKWIEAEAQLPDGRRVFGVSAGEPAVGRR